MTRLVLVYRLTDIHLSKYDPIYAYALHRLGASHRVPDWLSSWGYKGLTFKNAFVVPVP